MKLWRKIAGVLLVLVMLGSIVSPAMALTEKLGKENTKELSLKTKIFKELDNLKTKLGFRSTFKVESVKELSKEDMDKIVTNIIKAKLDDVGLNERDKIKIIKNILNYLKSKKLESPVIAKIRWLPEGEESIAVFDKGKIVFDSHLWFYGTKFVERKTQSPTTLAKSVHWSDHKPFYKVFDIYNIYGVKIATWTYYVDILTEISPSSQIELSGTGYIDGSVRVDISTKGYTINKPAVLIGDGASSGYAFNTYEYVTKVKITTPNQDLTDITKYDHFAAGRSSSIDANNGKDSASVSLGVSLGPFSVTNTPSNKFIKAEAGDSYGRCIKIINKYNPWHLTHLGNDVGVYFDNGEMHYSLKFRVGDNSNPNIGTVDVIYKINYVAVTGAVEFHSIASPDTYTAHLEFTRG